MKKSAEEIEIKTIELAVKLTLLKWFGTEQLASGQNELRNLLECVRRIRLVKLTCTRLLFSVIFTCLLLIEKSNT